MKKQKIIFDCDNTMGLPFKEVDDGLTLLYLLGRPEFEILGITTTFGNGRIDEVYPQTCRLVEALGLSIPVFKGEGYDGQPPETPAARFIAEKVMTIPNEITILATGPLGNVAAANKLNPHTFEQTQQIAVMGGYTAPLRLGFRSLGELNFSANPEAALATLQAPCPVTVMSGQACLEAPFTWRMIQQADWWPKAFKHMLKRWLLTFGLYCGVNRFYLWDLLPAVYLTDPQVFKPGKLMLGAQRQDMRRGMLFAAADANGHEITLPEGIVKKEAFYHLLEAAWQKSAAAFPVSKIPV
jgi:purine nucleosidase